MSIEWITYKEKKILYIKYSGLSAPDRLAQIEKATQILIDTKSNENLTLSDVSDTSLDQDFIALSKEKGKISGPLTKKAAIVGVEGIRKILLNAVNVVSGNPRQPFDTLEAAKDWLVT